MSKKGKRSWHQPGPEWKKTGDAITQKIDAAISTDVQQVMVNSQELIEAFKENLAMLGAMAGMVDERDEDQVRAFMNEYNGAILGMINLLYSAGVYSKEKAMEIQRLFFFPGGGDD